MNYRAVYHDKNGNTYSAPVEQRGETWMMLTSDGWQLIATTFDDDAGGRLTFSHYREEPDTRLHVEPKQPGQSSLAQLQSAAAKAEAQARADRKRNVQERVRQSNELDARRIQCARENNNLLATRWSRHRPDPVPPQIPSKEVMAEAARYRKRKTEET